MAPTSTLVAMAQRGLIRNLSALQDVGDTPYELVMPALRKIVDPQQLRTIEIACPHIADADSELWRNLIKRDIPDWEKKLVEPKNPRSWWKVYRKLYREEKAAQEAQQKQLEEALKGKQKEKEENQTNILNTVVQQRFRQKGMLDGVMNPRAGAYGNERVGTVANAKKSGRNIISAIRKAATKPTAFKVPANSGSAVAESRMWQKEIIPPGTWRREPPNLMKRGPQREAQEATEAALDRALKRDEQMKQEKARRISNSPPLLIPANSAAQAQSPPKPQPARPAFTQSVKAVQVTPAKAASPPPPMVASKPATPLGPGAGSKRPRSPEKVSLAAPPQKRPRPQTSIFMPKKARR